MTAAQRLAQRWLSALGAMTVPDPYTMSREEFLNPPEIKPSPGYRLLYHVTDRSHLESIGRLGLLTRHSKSPPEGSIWATTEPKGYTEQGSVVIFQVPVDDPLVEYVTGGGRQAIIMRDVPRNDILGLDPWLSMSIGRGRLSFLRSSQYAAIYYDREFGPKHR